MREHHNGGVQVDANGMYVGGSLLPAEPRQPAVALTGQNQISLHVGGGDVDETIRAITTDLRGLLAFAWTVNGQPYPDGESITLSFNPSVGPFGPENVALTVTDADGLTAQASKQIAVSLQQASGVGGGSDNPLHPA